jgi:hypothetical protein
MLKFECGLPMNDLKISILAEEVMQAFHYSEILLCSE